MEKVTVEISSVRIENGAKDIIGGLPVWAVKDLKDIRSESCRWFHYDKSTMVIEG